MPKCILEDEKYCRYCMRGSHRIAHVCTHKGNLGSHVTSCLLLQISIINRRQHFFYEKQEQERLKVKDENKCSSSTMETQCLHETTRTRSFLHILIFLFLTIRGLFLSNYNLFQTMKTKPPTEEILLFSNPVARAAGQVRRVPGDSP